MTTEGSTAPSSPAQDVTGARIGAAIIDIILLGVVFVVMAMLLGDFGSTENEDGSSSGFSASLGTAGSIIYFIIVMGYYMGMEVQMAGQTIGKKVTGIKVVTATGQPYDWGKSFIRNILRIIDGLPFLYLVGFIVMVSSKQKQRIGDMAAGTRIVKA